MMNQALIKILQLPIHIYRYLISPLIGSRCRYYPTCSAYALEALQKHGPFYGGLLSTLRILRCNPWIKANREDSVPTRFTWEQTFGYKHAQCKDRSCKGKTTP